MVLAGDVDEFGFDDERVFVLKDTAADDCADSEFGGGGKWVHAFSFVTEDDTVGHDSNFGQAREIVDDSFGDTVAEIVVRGIAAGVLEGQDGERIDRFPNLDLASFAGVGSSRSG